MPQIRKDYIQDKYVIIAAKRAKRPKDLTAKKYEISSDKNCPLCPHNEYMIPGVIDEFKNKDEWIVRAIWNKFKAVSKKGNPKLKTHNKFYTFADAVGEHEVIIETPKHGVEMEDLSKEHIKKILEMIIKRINENYKKGSKYVTVFKNRGVDAGASLSHSHHQIVSYNILPTEIKSEIEAVKEYKKGCPYCDIIKREKDSDRSIINNKNFLVFCPYASRFPMEVWITPKRCIHSITKLNLDEIDSLADIFKKILRKLNKLNYPSYNIFYKISSPKNSKYHFRLEIAPRLAKWAGFEYTTGTIINSVQPEAAAKFYKE